MTRKILYRFSLLTALVACAAPALAGSAALNYATDRKVVRACILSADANNPPAPYAFYMLDRSEQTITIAANGSSFVFYPPKPRGWEFENPLAAPGTPKSSPAYWGETVASLDLPRMKNYDLLLLPVTLGGVTSLSRVERTRLAAWVDMGGVLWVDRHQEGVSRDLTLFLEPTLSFVATDATLPVAKVAADASHPLLRGRFILSGEEIELLGRQLPYSDSPAGESALDGIEVMGTTPSALTEVVGGRRTERDGTDTAYYPVVAAARFGAGAVVVTACGVAEGIQDWYPGMAGGTAPVDLELVQWSLPDFKFVYNMVQWALDWSGQHGGSRREGGFAGLLPGPLTATWSRQAAVSGAPVVDRGVAYATYLDPLGGALGLFDVVPSEARARGPADDGLLDYSQGASADEIGRVLLVGDAPVGAPALASVYDAFGLAYEGGTPQGLAAGPRPIAVVAARVPDADDSMLYAFPADPDVYALGTPAGPHWSAVINDGAGTQYGVATTGPAVADNMILLATSDSGSDQAPNRDGHLLVYEASAASAGESKTPTALVRLARGGQALEITSPPAVAYATVWDDAINTWAIAQVAVLSGNGLPRVGTAATGQVRVVPLAVRFPASGWDHVWLADPTAGQTLANQLVKVETAGAVQIPPHQDDLDDVEAPLNYVRRVQGNYIEILFTRFALFRGQYDTGGQPLKVSFRDTSGVTRTVSADFQSGYATFIRSRVADNGQSSPSVSGDVILATGEAINAYPTNSVHGNVTAMDLAVSRGFATRWVLNGDITGGPDRVDPADPRDYFTSFSFSPAYAGDVVYVGGNYEFSQERGSRQTEAMPAGPAGALYALNAKASPNLLSVSPSDPNLYVPATATVSADPTLAGGLPDPEAPVDQSADPNQVVPSGRRGVPVWITTQTDPADDSPSYAIPQRSGTTVNWAVDFGNGIIRLAPGAFGKYQGRALRVRYFSGLAIPNGGRGVIVQADRLVNWVYHFARFDQATGDEVASARIVSPPVAAKGAVHVMVCSNVEQPDTDTDTATYRRYLVSLSPNPADPASADRLINPWAEPTARWQPVGPAVSNETIVAGLAATAGRVIAATQIGSQGYLEGFADAVALVADNERVLEAQGGAEMAWVGLGGREPHASPKLISYVEGVANVLQGQAQVTGVGTDWSFSGRVSPDDWFRVRGPGQPWYRILTVDFDTQLTLAENYAGANAAGVAYDIATGSSMDQAIPAYDAYADSAYRGFSRPSWARNLAGGRVLVSDTGHDRVVEVGRGGDVAWEYPGVLLSRTLYFAGLADTDGSDVVTGNASTFWTVIVSPGDRFRIDGDTNWYTVESVDADDVLTLTTPYPDLGPLAAYTIVHIHREVTPQEQRLLGPMDAHRYRKRLDPIAGVTLADPTGEVNRTYTATAGTATATNGSPTVTGSGALWASYVRAGDLFRLDADGTWYAVARVDTNEKITLTEDYAEAGGTGSYVITTAVIEEREATLIADTGHNRVVEVIRPLLNGKYRPWVYRVIGSDTVYYRQHTEELVGPKTVWNDEEPQALGVKISPSYVERLGDPDTVGGATDRLVCAVINNPPDPSGRDTYLRLIDVAVGYQALPLDPRVVALSMAQLQLDPGTNLWGLNLFAPRAAVQRDMLGIRQAQQIPAGGATYTTLVVDDSGVKEIDNTTWDGGGTGLVFEFNAADTAANYLDEMQALKDQLENYAAPPYPLLIDEPTDALRWTAYQNALTYASDTVDRYAINGQVDFLPVAAWKNRAAGTYTIVNAYADPYQALGGEPIGARVKSEVFEVDPRLDLDLAYRVGKRIVKWDFDSSLAGALTDGGDTSSPLYGFGSWPHFILPDPSRSVYPWIAGASYGLKQPRGVDRH